MLNLAFKSADALSVLFIPDFDKVFPEILIGPHSLFAILINMKYHILHFLSKFKFISKNYTIIFAVLLIKLPEFLTNMKGDVKKSLLPLFALIIRNFTGLFHECDEFIDPE